MLFGLPQDSNEDGSVLTPAKVTALHQWHLGSK
jgi:hypothetical protein